VARARPPGPFPKGALGGRCLPVPPSRQRHDVRSSVDGALVDSTHCAAKPHDAPAKTSRRNAPELTPSRPPPEIFIGENRSRPNREETSVQEMDAYRLADEIPCYRLKLPCSSKYFPC
jgi:hypothetical protein